MTVGPARDPGSLRAGLVMIGIALMVLTALGAPALRALGDSGFIAVALASGGLVVWATQMADRCAGHRALALILAVGLLLRLIVLPIAPILSSDIFRYVWDGRVQAAGINPYRYVPTDPALAALRDVAIYPHINRADYAVTIYPPVAQGFFLLVTRVAESLFVMKAALVLCEAVTVAVVIDLLRRLHRPMTRVVAYAWHPLPVWEVANNGHVDALMVALMMSGLWLALVKGRALGGAAMIALGALVKPFAVLALPALWRPFDWRMPLVVVAVAAIAYAPYLSVGTGVIGFLGGGYLAEEQITNGGGFWLLSVWRALAGVRECDTAVYLSLSVLALAALALRAALRRERTAASVLAEINLMLLAFFFLLSPEFPWYFLMVVPVLAIIGGAPGWALTIGGFMLYDIVPGEISMPLVVRDAVFNGLFLVAAASMMLRRRSLPVGTGVQAR